MFKNHRVAFFGTPEIAVFILKELEKAEITPDLIITNPDAPVGRKQVLTPPPVKNWANLKNLPVIQPESLKNEDFKGFINKTAWDLFIVAAYGKIIPQAVLDLPKFGTLNVHPSLLPKFRGASPIRSAILEDEKDTGVTIMLMDDKMDHGPIVVQEKTPNLHDNWPVSGTDLDKIMAQHGGQLLAKILPDFLAGKITPKEQDHETATFCQKISKNDGELNINPHKLPQGAEAYQNLLKIKAFAGWPETYFIFNNKRFKIKQANLDQNGALQIERIVPEGKKETDFKQYFS